MCFPKVFFILNQRNRKRKNEQEIGGEVAGGGWMTGRRRRLIAGLVIIYKSSRLDTVLAKHVGQKILVKTVAV